MTPYDLLKAQMEDAEYQLRKAIEGLTDEHIDAKPLANLLSPRESIVHLGEAYAATLKHLAGEKHSWGTFKTQNTAWNEQVAEVFGLRASAVQAVLAGHEEELGPVGNTYIVAHDYYHVGQLCAARLAVDPNWDAYSIYNF